MFIGESTYVCKLVFDGEDEGNKLYFAFRRYVSARSFVNSGY
jgi:hypothetical protein